MNIRSIDLQVMIPRTTEVSKVQHIADQQSALQQQQFNEQWKQAAAHRQQQVQSSPRTEGGKVNDQEKEKNRRRDQAKREATPSHPDTDPEGESAAENSALGHHIDIKT